MSDTDFADFKKRIRERLVSIHEKLADIHPSLTRGQVWCRECGHTQKVDSAQALATGWPKHCGQTMTIDSPEEQQRYAGK